MRNQVLHGDVLDLLPTLPPRSVQCCITSPPYYALRDYALPPGAWPALDYAPLAGLPPVHVDAQLACLGLERGLADFVGHLVHVFRLLKPALKPGGTLWLNLGDAYAGGSSARDGNPGGIGRQVVPAGLKKKDLMGVPWRCAFALQADGWYLRAENIWHKSNPMPSSIKDRTTNAHEHLFMLSLRPAYFYDAHAIAEPCVRGDAGSAYTSGKTGTRHPDVGRAPRTDKQAASGLRTYVGLNARTRDHPSTTRNKRDVWTIPTTGFAEAHYSTFPPDLARPPILAGTSAKGECPECGLPWLRTLTPASGGSTGKDWNADKANRNVVGHSKRSGATDWGTYTPARPSGWRAQCAHNHEPVPQLVLDPFLGSGTVAQVCIEEGRDWLGLDLDARAADWANGRSDGAQRRLGL